MGKQQNLIKIEELKLLPQTHDFFDTRVSKSIPVFIATVISLLIIFIIWACLAKLDDVVKANAMLRPIDNISELRCLVNGEIAYKNYIQNQKVKQGDLLLAVDCTSEKQELDSIIKQIAREESELNSCNDFLKYIQDGVIPNNIDDFLKNKINSYESEYKKQELQIQDIEYKYNSEKSMPETLKLQQKMDELRNQLQQLEYGFTNWKNSQLIHTKELINSYEDSIQNMKLRCTVLERNIKNASLYSPIDGIVNEITALNVGDYVIGGSEILRVIPSENERLKAEIVLDASRIARIKKGQIVKLRFPGLPPSKFGQLKGIVSLIPADITINSSNPVFVVEAEIPETCLYANSGEKINLRAGLSAEARIIIANDSVMNMILRKLDFIN